MARLTKDFVAVMRAALRDDVAVEFAHVCTLAPVSYLTLPNVTKRDNRLNLFLQFLPTAITRRAYLSDIYLDLS